MFERNVFINCPFDDTFKPKLRAIMFAVTYAGYNVKIAETNDSGSLRLNDIVKLMLASKYAIHDISLKKSTKAGELARFNMPFELGIDLGIRQKRGKQKLGTKQFIVLDDTKYEYQAALSDLGGCDPFVYGNITPHEDIFEILANWFNKIENSNRLSLSDLDIRFFEFEKELEDIILPKRHGKRELANMPRSTYIRYIKNWISGDIKTK